MVVVKKDVDVAVRTAVAAAIPDVDVVCLPETAFLTEIPVAVFFGSSFLCASAAITITEADAHQETAVTAAGLF